MSFGGFRSRSSGGTFGRTNTNNNNPSGGVFNSQGGGGRYGSTFSNNNNNNQNNNNPQQFNNNNQNNGGGINRFGGGGNRFGNNRFGSNNNQNQGNNTGFNNNNNAQPFNNNNNSNQNNGGGINRFGGGGNRFGNTNSNNQNQGRFGFGSNNNNNQNQGNNMGFNNNNNNNNNQNIQNTTGTGIPPFENVREADGTVGAPPVFFATITAMPQYGNKSLEELRMEDLLTGRYGPGANQRAQQLAQSGNMQPTQTFNTNTIGTTSSTNSRFGSGTIGAGGGIGGGSRFGFGNNNATNTTNTTSPSRFGFGKFGATGTNQNTGTNNTTGGTSTGFGFGRTSSGGTSGFGFGRTSTGSTTGATGGTTSFGGRFGSSASTGGTSRFGFGNNNANNQTTGGTTTVSRFGFGSGTRTSFGSTNSTTGGTTTGSRFGGFGSFGNRTSSTDTNNANNNSVVHANFGSTGSGGGFDKKYNEFSAEEHEKQTSEAFATLMANAARAAGVSEAVISQLTMENAAQNADAILSRAKAEAEEAKRQAQAEKEANEARMESIRMQSRMNSVEAPMRTGSGGVMRVRSAQPLTTMFSPVRTASAMTTNTMATRTLSGGPLPNTAAVPSRTSSSGLPGIPSSSMLGTRTMSSTLDASLQLSALGTRTNSGLMGSSTRMMSSSGLPTRTSSMMLTAYGKGPAALTQPIPQRTVSGRDIRIAIEKPVVTNYEEISGIRVPSYNLVEPLLTFATKESKPVLNDDNHVRLRVVLSKDLETNYIANVSNNERRMYKSSAGDIPTLTDVEQDDDMKLAIAALSAVDKVWIEVDPSVTSVEMLKHEVVEARIRKASEILEKLRTESINAGLDRDTTNDGILDQSSPLREDKPLSYSRLSTSGSSVTGRSNPHKQEQLRTRSIKDENILRRLSSGIDKYFKLADNDSKTVLFEKSVVRNKVQENKLKDYNLLDSKDILALWYPEQQQQSQSYSSSNDYDSGNYDQDDSYNNDGNNEYSNGIRDEYSNNTTSYPSAEVLFQMDTRAKSQVPNFRVECDGMGSVEWLEPVDLNNVDVHNDILFEKNNVHVNNPSLLNKRALITLENVWNETELSNQEYIAVLEKHCEDTGSRFEAYNPETGQYSFIVDHF